MEVAGILFALLDIPREQTEEYNRWYDLDHMPEHISKADVLTAKRYVAPRDLQELGGGGQRRSPAGTRRTSRCTTSVATTSPATRRGQGWTTKDRGIIKSGRFWRSGSPTFVRRWRLAETFTRASVLVSDEAVPYLAHRGCRGRARARAVGRAA